jgi:hypothetical protein
MVLHAVNASTSGAAKEFILPPLRNQFSSSPSHYQPCPGFSAAYFRPDFAVEFPPALAIYLRASGFVEGKQQ